MPSCHQSIMTYIRLRLAFLSVSVKQLIKLSRRNFLFLHNPSLLISIKPLNSLTLSSCSSYKVFRLCRGEGTCEHVHMEILTVTQQSFFPFPSSSIVTIWWLLVVLSWVFFISAYTIFKLAELKALKSSPPLSPYLPLQVIRSTQALPYHSQAVNCLFCTSSGSSFPCFNCISSSACLPCRIAKNVLNGSSIIRLIYIVRYLQRILR